jgi:hypothetical protein
MVSDCDGPQKDGSEETTGANPTELEEDILKLTKLGGPSPSYDLA